MKTVKRVFWLILFSILILFFSHNESCAALRIEDMLNNGFTSYDPESLVGEEIIPAARMGN